MADLARVCLHLERIGLNGNALSHRTDLERNIDANCVVHIQCNAGALVALEAWSFHLNLVGPNREFGGVVNARSVAGGGSDETGVTARDRNLGVWDHGARWIGHRPDNRGCSLAVCYRAQYSKPEHKQQGYRNMKWMGFSKPADFTCPPKEPLFPIFLTTTYARPPRDLGIGFASVLSNDVFIER